MFFGKVVSSRPDIIEKVSDYGLSSGQFEHSQSGSGSFKNHNLDQVPETQKMYRSQSGFS